MEKEHIGENLPWHRQQGDWSVVTAFCLWTFSFIETDDNAVPPWAESALENFGRNTVGA